MNTWKKLKMNGGRIYVKMRKFKINNNITPFYLFIYLFIYFFLFGGLSLYNNMGSCPLYRSSIGLIFILCSIQ